MIEIERKFLVTSNAFKRDAQNTVRITQGFLNTHPDRTVRIRLTGTKGKLTIKGRSSNDGLSRFEWEKDISLKDAEVLLELCEAVKIDKIRHLVTFENHTFEVDEFLGENEGLIVAEVELRNENETFNRPEWLGKEVTGEMKYYNSQLSLKPFKYW